MEIQHNIKMDLSKTNSTPRIPVVQGDAGSRKLDISLLSDGKPWHIPADAKAVVRYRKPNRTAGTYDTLADGTNAVSISGNHIRILVAPESLTSPGIVSMMVTIMSGQQKLSTFAVELDVASDYSSEEADTSASAWISGLLPAPSDAVAEQYLVVDTVDEQGHVLSLRTQDVPGLPVDQVQEVVAQYLEEHNIAAGADGISVSHAWNGTVLTVTSASGSSSADLKGEAGKTGPQGPQGETGPQGPQGETGLQGEDGLTPFIGEDGHWWIGETDTGVSASGSASGEECALPSVTTADDGKFLRVADGIWSAVAVENAEEARF